MEVNQGQGMFQSEKHVKFLRRNLDVLPHAYGSLDSSRMTVVFFTLSGLDILNSLNYSKVEVDAMIKWIYAQQILPKEGEQDMSKCGFRGSPFIGFKFDPKGSFTASEKYEGGHIAMTYTALCCLLVLGDDLNGVSKDGVIQGLKKLQLKDGSFCPTPDGSENDMRFIYCACCISYILNDWRGINIDRAVKYIRNSMAYDYGIGQGPELESHGGSTFCALASLVLMSKLESCFTIRERERLKRWCLVRQKSGFQGRPNKPVDTCYSFWVGASLKLLGAYDLTEKNENRAFLMTTQHSITGGFSKWPDFHPDVLHTYFGLCGLSLIKEPGINPIHSALNISVRSYEHLMKLRNDST